MVAGRREWLRREHSTRVEDWGNWKQRFKEAREWKECVYVLKKQ